MYNWVTWELFVVPTMYLKYLALSIPAYYSSKHTGLCPLGCTNYMSYNFTFWLLLNWFMGPGFHHFAIYLWTKVACFVVMRSTKPGYLRLCSWCLSKALDEEGFIWACFHHIWTCSAKVLEYWMISSLKIVADNFGGIGMCLWCCWKDLDEQDLMELILVRFGFRIWEILILKWKLPLKIQINSKKPGFGRKIQLRTW